jgi:hypothetical protein
VIESYFVFNGGAVDWRSKKQSVLAMDATESEYIAASEAAMEAVWIRKFVSGLGVMPSIQRPIKMYCDNSAATTFSNEPGIMKVMCGNCTRLYLSRDLEKLTTPHQAVYLIVVV